MTEDEILWLDFEKAVEETLDSLFKARFEPIYVALAYAAYEQLHSVWYWVKASRYGWECDNLSP